MTTDSGMRPLAFQVLRALSAQQFVSGAALARSLGVSRSAISDALMDASAQGIDIFKVTRKGYRLAAPLDLLDIAAVREQLGDAARRVDVHIVETIASTNSELVRRAALGAAGGSCIAAEIQTAGRGRRGREWQSALGNSLTFSLLWRFERGAAQLGGLSLVVGLAIVRALRKLGATEAGVKWPNDIVVGAKKLGGVLIETQGDMLGPSAVVIGIGLNLRLDATVTGKIDQPATDLAAQLARPVSRNAVLAMVVRELAKALDQFTSAGFAPFRAEWIACHVLHQREIRVMRDADDAFDAFVRDVAADGSLIVEAAGRQMQLSGGEISVRGVPTSIDPAAAPRRGRGPGPAS